MKTYLLDILNRYNRFSENLDVKTILCNKSWLIFNDSGEKELYIFQENGSLIASINGNVTNATWQYISANKSLLISFKEQSYMLHPSFIDNTIFALQQDGTERFLFMISEEQSTSFYPKSLKELNFYFERMEHKKIEEEKQQKLKLLEQQRIEQLRITEERKNQEQYEIREKERQKEQAIEKKALGCIFYIMTFSICVILVMAIILIISIYCFDFLGIIVGVLLEITILLAFTFTYFAKIVPYIEDKFIKRYKQKNGK